MFLLAAISAELLSRCTLYSSTEPCPMCAGSIFCGGRVVRCEQAFLRNDRRPPDALLPLSRRFRARWPPIEVLGPGVGR
jgi:hypothetical protein